MFRRRKIRIIEERIARLTAENAYWGNKVAMVDGGGLPWLVCEGVATRMGEIAALEVRLEKLRKPHFDWSIKP